MGEHLTGYHHELPKEYHDVLGETGAEVMKDFGADITTKWLNVGIFAAVYGMCGFEWLKGLRDFKEKEAAEAEKKKKKQAGKVVEISQHSRDRGEGIR